MKQVLQREGRALVEEVPAPVARAGFALVRTAASLVSAGTERAAAAAGQKGLLLKALERPDRVRQVLQQAAANGVANTIEAVRGRMSEPVLLGYSASGVVLDAGEIPGVRAGDLIACAGAGYANHAEVLSVPRNLCAVVPDGVSAEDACFATVGAIALHGVRLAEPTVGATAAVIGLGLVGQLAAQILTASGCKVLGIDLRHERVELARRMGAAAGATADEAMQAAAALTGGIGVDLVIVAADAPNSEPINLAGTIARDRATVVVVGAVGMEVPRGSFYAKELRLLVSRSYGPGRYDESYEVHGYDYPIGHVRWTEQRNLSSFLDLVANRRVRVGDLVSHRFAITGAHDAYEVINGREPSLGVVLQYPDIADLSATVRRAAPLGGKHIARGTRIGVFGTGEFAKAVLIPSMKAVGAELAAIAGRQGASAKACADRFGFEYCATDQQQILSDDSIAAVVIATRHDRHAQQVLDAARHGKDVFVEKPLCLRIEELDAIERAFTADGASRLMVGYNRRFAMLAQEFKAFIRSGTGPVMVNYRVNAGFVPASHWIRDEHQGGGRIIGEACHFVDFCGWLADARPLRVTAHALRGAPDDMVLSIEYADGSVASISYITGGDAALGKERVEAFGGGRCAVLDDFRSVELYRGKRRTVIRSKTGQDKGHKAECAAFLRAMTGGEPSPIALADLIATSRVTFLARESARSGSVPQQIA